MSDAPKTVWVTKYALTSGMYEAEISGSSGFASLTNVKHPRGLGTLVLVPSEHRPTREAALTRANEMRAAKIASLKRQIEKLEALEF